MAKKILMSKEEAKGLSASESIKFVKDMLKTKTKKLTLKDFEPGSLLMYRYNAKDRENTFDATPLALVLKTSRRYVLSINFHWLPVPLRIILVKKILQMNAKNNDSTLTFNEAREDDLTINRIAKFLEHQNQLKQEQFKSVLQYITNVETCKNKLLLAYFDEIATEDCGICSFCMTKKKTNPIETVVLIEQLVQKSPMTSREIEDSLQISAEATIFALQLLLEQNKIAINSHNQYYIQHGKT